MENPGTSARWTRRLLIGAAGLCGAALLLGATGAAAHRPGWRPPGEHVSVSVTLEDARGNPLRTFSHHGRRFVLGEFGERYVVRIDNHSARRVEAVLAVDGRDAVNGRRSDPARDRGYVIAPFGSVRVEGFRTSLDSVATFRFTDPGDSYAGRLGSTAEAGTIRVSVFPERERPVALAERDEPWRRRGKKQHAPASAPRAAGSARSADSLQAERGNLGTEFGEERDSRVREVPFVRAHRTRPARVVSIFYDDAEGLASRGIEIWPRRRAAWGDDEEVEPRDRWARPPP
jgi:hypothetical protein